MKRLLSILMLGFCCANFTACDFGDLFDAPEVEDDLSYLYIKSRKDKSVYYGMGTEVLTESTSSRVFTYDGNRVVGEVCDYSSVQYENGDVFYSQSHHEEVDYLWNGLVCTQKWESGNTVVEYLDDTCLRIKTQESDSYKLVYEYDGKKITKESCYVDDELQYEKVYEYNGLTATFVQNNHTPIDNPEIIGIQTQIVGGKVTYQDSSYLRIVSQEVEIITSVGDTFKEIMTNTYDGPKCTKSEVRLEGEFNGYSYGDNAVYMRTEYEWDGLKCKCTTTQYSQDPQPPYNEHNGKVVAVTDVEMEYLEIG